MNKTRKEDLTMKTNWKIIPKDAIVTICEGTDITPYREEHFDTDPDYTSRGTVNGEECRIGFTEIPSGDAFFRQAKATHYAPAEQIRAVDLEDL